MTNAIQKKDEPFNFQITSLDQAMQYAKLISESDLAPKDYKSKPGNVLIAIQYGLEIGLKPMQAIQNIAVINGRPAVWGDAMLGIVQSNPLCEYIREKIENGKAYCTVKRRGDEKEYTYTFSIEEAKAAGLLGKAGPWTQYRDRMLQMRARAFALRDKFSDVLKGISMREEVQDYVVVSPIDKKMDDSAKIDLILAKKIEEKPQLVFEDVNTMLQDATNKEELEKAAAIAKNLSDADKEKARKVYKTKQAKFVNQETGELIPNDFAKG